MPYKTLSDLPDSVREYLPMHTQKIYLAAFISAWDEYRNAKDRCDKASREQVAHKVAWALLKCSTKSRAIKVGVKNSQGTVLNSTANATTSEAKNRRKRLKRSWP